MQKIFIRYFVVIMAVTVGVTLLCNFAIQTVFSQKKAQEEAFSLLEEIDRRIAGNNEVIHSLTLNLNDNYLARARAFAEIIAQNPSVIKSYMEMERIAALLNVEEVHVIDEDGILRWGNIPVYYGLDFAATDQTRPFLPALTDKSFALAQEPQPNGYEGKLFQYISVARQDQPGIVQVGVAPEILDNALSNNKIGVVISSFNVQQGVNVTAIDKESGLVVGDSKGSLVGRHYKEAGVDESFFSGEKTSGWAGSGNGRVFTVYGGVGNYLMRVSFTSGHLFADRTNQNIAAAACSILLGIAIIAAIFILLKRMIIEDMERVNSKLKKITAGDLSVVVEAKSTPEFVSLSGGINEMVDSLRQQLEEITQQASTLQQQAVELEEHNLNILASLKYARKIQNSLLPSPKAFAETFRDYSVLWEPRDEVGGDIYWIKRFPEGAVLCVCDCTGHGTPGALLTMLVVSALDAIVDEATCRDTANILWQLEQRLVNTLNVAEGEKGGANIADGADLSIMFLPAQGGDITLSSAKLHVFVCNGRSVESIRGQKLSIGDGSLKSREQINTLAIPVSPESSYYIVSDGLFDQVGGNGNVPFGYSRFKSIILESHGQSQEEITQKLWLAFEAYMAGEARRDDVTLVSFKL